MHKVRMYYALHRTYIYIQLQFSTNLRNVSYIYIIDSFILIPFHGLLRIPSSHNQPTSSSISLAVYPPRVQQYIIHSWCTQEEEASHSSSSKQPCRRCIAQNPRQLCVIQQTCVNGQAELYMHAVFASCIYMALCAACAVCGYTYVSEEMVHYTYVQQEPVLFCLQYSNVHSGGPGLFHFR